MVANVTKDLRWWYGAWPGARLYDGDPRHDSELIAEVYKDSGGGEKWVAMFRGHHLDTFATERRAKMACRAALRRSTAR